jgi:hypothetical protein
LLGQEIVEEPELEKETNNAFTHTKNKTYIKYKTVRERERKKNGRESKSETREDRQGREGAKGNKERITRRENNFHSHRYFFIE